VPSSLTLQGFRIKISAFFIYTIDLKAGDWLRTKQMRRTRGIRTPDAGTKVAVGGRFSSWDNTPRLCKEAPRMSRQHWRGQLRAADERCLWQQKT
jgi:hypothetical protein